MHHREPPKSRGAMASPPCRYDRLTSEAIDDGWEDGDDPVPDPRTVILEQKAASILTGNDSPDIPFAQSINIYRGCEHGCAYCFARPSHAHLGFSPGLDFETRIVAKTNAAGLLETELRRPSYRCQPIAVGTNTDPYQPAERRLGLMRACLQVMSAFAQPVSITTKGALVLRDRDILAPMAAGRLASVAVSLTTLDRDLCRRLEPRAATPSARLGAIEGLAKAGIPVTVMVAPVIPALTDHELERILTAAREAGASAATALLLRLPGELAEMFPAWLAHHYPGRAGHVLSLVKAQRGGRLNQAAFFKRFAGDGPHARLLRERLILARRRLGLEDGQPALDSTRFRVPPRPGDQLALF